MLLFTGLLWDTQRMYAIMPTSESGCKGCSGKSRSTQCGPQSSVAGVQAQPRKDSTALPGERLARGADQAWAGPPDGGPGGALTAET